MEIGEPKKTHTDIPKPHDIPELEPNDQPQKIETPEKKEQEIPA